MPSGPTWSQQHFPQACDSLIQQLTRLQRTRERLSVPDSSVNPIWEAILQVGKELNWDEVKSILEPVTDDIRLDKAKTLYQHHVPALNNVADGIKTQWRRVFDFNRTELEKLLTESSQLRECYKLFDFDDMVSLAFLEGSDVSEHTQTEIYRVSPVDGIDRPLNQKLAGYALYDFGAFLEEKWRENDMLWGRLDACERIVSAVLNHPDDRERKDEFVKRLQNAIIEQEAPRSKIDLTPALAAARQGTLPNYLKFQYKLPERADPSQSASQVAKATDILRRMIEADLGVKNGTTERLRNLAKLAASVIALVTPGGMGRVFLKYCLQLLGLMAVLMVITGWLAQKTEVERVGLFVGVFLAG